VYIAMELVSGQDLFDVLVRERRLSQARAARIFLQVCAALDAAHQHGVVHRDLKPENVMLVRDPDDPDAELVKVLDFGIAKLLEREHVDEDDDDDPADRESLITLVGTVIGTPEYMSPEQARGTPPIDARSDVYAAGVLLYHLVTGKLPFRGDSAIEVILQHIERAPVPPRAIVPELHPELERIILTALGKWPDSRQSSARKLAEEVAAILPWLDSPSIETTEEWIDAELLEDPDDGDDDRAATTVRPRPEPALLEASAVAAFQPLPSAVVAPGVRRSSAHRAVLGWVARWWVFLVAFAVLSAAAWLAHADAIANP
jgi:serine/threonine protein kinase